MYAHTLRLFAAAGLSALALFVTACSADNGTSEQSSSAGSGQGAGGGNRSAEDERARQNDCLRKNGATITEGDNGAGAGVDFGDLDEAEQKKVMEKCGLAEAAQGGEVSQADKDKAFAFAKCMREEGLEFADPQFGDGAAMKGQQIPEGQEEEYKAASDTCMAKVGY
ncbi:hypothetical protein [Streptomyces sp. NPDC098781]|uniref:hypothetical protein n=1 Tax=Streptomyces sp. NPDC098781 TaxID=3366097 RepID=UPI00380D25E6